MEPEPGEVALVARLRRGDAGAFDVVYDRHHRPLYAFLRRLAGRRELADDLFQDVWLRLARHAGRLREDTNLRAWLYAVARNLHVSHRRWLLFDAERLRRFGLASPDRHEETPYDGAVRGEAERRLDQALGTLAPADREVLLLVCVHGFEPREAAEVLGLRADTLRQRLARARDRLAARLARGNNEGRTP